MPYMGPSDPHGKKAAKKKKRGGSKPMPAKKPARPVGGMNIGFPA